MAAVTASHSKIPEIPESLSDFEKRERKREQNRIAQRNYRRNQKKRLIALELAAAQIPHPVNGIHRSDLQIILPTVTATSPVGGSVPALRRPPRPPAEPRSPDSGRPSASGTGSPDPTSAEMPDWTIDPAVEPFPELPSGAFSADSLYQSYATPLHVAISRGNESMVRLLLQHGADALRRDHNGSTALHLAAEAGNESLVQLLLESMNPDELDYSRRTALCRAIEAGNDAVVELLLAAAADVNLKDIWGNSALHFAVKAGSERLTLLLLEHGADVDAGSQ